MIFVTIGTSEPFERLLVTVSSWETDEEVVAQVGASTTRPAGALCHEFLSFDETVNLMRRARLVVSHAGVGTVLTALRLGHVPVVVPRLRRFGEAVDDHQVMFARRASALGVVRLVEDLSELDPHMEGHGSAEVRGPVHSAPSALAVDIRSYLRGILAIECRPS
jgi:UDP-N-acetylglucosamine transferase subunit ALG13